MDSVTRVFPGQLRSWGVTPHPSLQLLPKPQVQVELLFGRDRLAVPFMIDTGADFTIVQPRTAARVLRSQDQHVPTASDVVQIYGVGQGTVRTRVRTLGLSLTDNTGQQHWFSSPVLLVEPSDSDPESSMWRLPSLLGRDVLQHFDLYLSYDPPTVSLTLND